MTARKGERAVACPQRRFVHSLQRRAVLRLAAADDSFGGAAQSADGNATALPIHCLYEYACLYLRIFAYMYYACIYVLVRLSSAVVPTHTSKWSTPRPTVAFWCCSTSTRIPLAIACFLLSDATFERWLPLWSPLLILSTACTDRTVCDNVVRLRMYIYLLAQVDFFLAFPSYNILPQTHSNNILLTHDFFSILAGTISLGIDNYTVYSTHRYFEAEIRWNRIWCWWRALYRRTRAYLHICMYICMCVCIYTSGPHIFCSSR